jgi:probable HAF family extracellular repeat protein
VSLLRRVLAAAFVLCCAGPAGAVPTFTPLGGGLPSRANGVSADGTWVVGTGTGPSGPVAFRWSASTGLQVIGDGTANGVSDDGSVVVGGSNFGSGPEAYRWTAGGGMAGLGDLPTGGFMSHATAVSGDGSVVVGYSDSDHVVVDDLGDTRVSAEEAFRWDAATGMVGLGIVAPGPWYNSFYSIASGISQDGAVIAGTSSDYNDAPFHWTQTGGMETDCFECELVGAGISPDGKTIVGGILDPSWGGAAFRWDFETEGLEFLDTPDGLAFSAALDASLGGEFLVGFVGDFETGETQAALWDDENNVYLLSELLAELGLGLPGWTLESATAISADGRTIVGYGINPDGFREAWVVNMPEPGTALLLALGLSILAAHRRH